MDSFARYFVKVLNRIIQILNLPPFIFGKKYQSGHDLVQLVPEIWMHYLNNNGTIYCFAYFSVYVHHFDNFQYTRYWTIMHI